MLHRLVALVLLSAGALLGLAPPAAAAGVSLFVADGISYDGCQTHPYAFTVSPPVGTAWWYVSLEADGPAGSAIDSIHSQDGATSGTRGLEICDERAGRWTLTATARYFDAAGLETTEQAVTGFALRRHQTRTQLRVSARAPRLNQAVRFLMRSVEEGPQGFGPAAGEWVQLEAKVRGRWVTVRGSRQRTDAGGRVRVAFRWDIPRGFGLTLRAKTRGDGSAAQSVSSAITVRTR